MVTFITLITGRGGECPKARGSKIEGKVEKLFGEGQHHIKERKPKGIS